MAGMLLRSGSVKHFRPLGATGNPVYRAASQLRVAMRRHLGQETADYFAVPQQDDKGDTIDWYAPMEGNVVPWTAATAEERIAAKRRLVAAQEALGERSRALQAGEGSEQQIFGRLLALATRIPSEDHVYLVDGRPVMTFWGFADRDAPDYQDVLGALDTGEDQVVDAAAVGDANADSAASRRERAAGWRRWLTWPWLLLPLLLLGLLGLLLFGLRGCLPVGGPGVLVPESEPRATLEPKPDVLPPVEREAGVAGNDASESEAGLTQSGTLRRRTAVDEIHEDGVVGRSGDILGRDADTAEGSVVPVPEPGTSAEGAGAKGTEAEEPKAEPGSPEPALPPEDEAGKAGPEKDASAPMPEAPTDQPPAVGGDRGADAGQTAGPEAAQETGPPLTIPRDAAEKGSTDFLNGRWRSVTGLQDAAGNPVQLEYDFKDGKGTATLKQNVGGREQTCTAGVRSAFRGSRLVIDQAEDIRCPDGTRFQRSSVECATNAQGRAECHGKNQDGSGYQVRINKK